MLLLLFLFIIPSAIGVYFLLKPPVELDSEVEVKPVNQVVTQVNGYEDFTASTTNANRLIRQQTVNE